MSEHIHEQISAFLDDELSSEESAFLVRRLTSDTLAHRQTVRYSTIGSVLREENLLANSGVLRERIHAVLDGVSVAQGTARVRSRRQARWSRLVAAVGVAASVAIVSIFVLRTMNESESSAIRSAAIVPGIWNAARNEAFQPAAAQSGPVAATPIWMTNYLVQHGSFASTLNRTSVHSNVIGWRATERPVDAEPASTERTATQVQTR